jgi:urease accessory protein
MLHKPDFAKVAEDLSPGALYRLMTWLSPAYPIGAFSYSSGLELAVEAGDVTDMNSLRRWLKVIITAGGGYCDAIFLAQAHRAIMRNDADLLREVASLAAAFAPSKERFLESTVQGQAFVDATRAAWPCRALNRLIKVSRAPIALPIAVGVTCAGHDIPLAPSIHGYLHAFTANLVSAGVRLIPLGQTDGQRLIAALEPDITLIAERAGTATLDDLGTSAFRVDLASMHHEAQYTRLFRS